MNMKRRGVLWSLVGFSAGLAGALAANVVPVPHIFTAGTAARAAEVNENFDALAQRLSSLESSPVLADVVVGRWQLTEVRTGADYQETSPTRTDDCGFITFNSDETVDISELATQTSGSEVYPVCGFSTGLGSVTSICQPGISGSSCTRTWSVVEDQILSIRTQFDCNGAAQCTSRTGFTPLYAVYVNAAKIRIAEDSPLILTRTN